MSARGIERRGPRLEQALARGVVVGGRGTHNIVRHAYHRMTAATRSAPSTTSRRTARVASASSASRSSRARPTCAKSPYVALARTLASRGIRVRVWDELVRADASCDPAWFAASPAALAAGVDTVVVCHGESATLAAIAAEVSARHAIVDLTGLERDRFAHAAYRSVAWRPERTGA